MSRNGRPKRKTAAKSKKSTEQSKLRKLDKDSYYDDTVIIETSSATDSDDDVVLLDELSTKKVKSPIIQPTQSSDTSWCERYAPTDRASLVVHKQKLIELENCLVSILDAKSSSSKQSSNILVLTGPSGCEKTSALRVLADEMGVKLIEWHRVSAQQHVWSHFSNSNVQSASDQGWNMDGRYNLDDMDEFASETRVFERFLMNAIRRNTLELEFEDDTDTQATKKRIEAPTSRDSRSRASNGRAVKAEKANAEKGAPRHFPGGRVVLVRELPTAYFMNVSAFHALLEMISRQPRSTDQPVCVAFVVATQTVPFRGALERDSRQEANERVRDTAWRTTKRDAFETLFPLGALRSRGVTPHVVRFNAITTLNAQRALTAICECERANGNNNVARLNSDALNALVSEMVASSNADLRCAVNALQFRIASSVYDGAAVTGRRRKVAHASRAPRGAVPQVVKDDRLTLFRAVGRLLYYDPAKYNRQPPAPVAAEAANGATLSSLVQLDDDALIEDTLYRSDVADSFDFFAAMLHEAYCDVFVDTESVACLANAFSETDALGGSNLQMEHRRAIEPDRVSVLTRSFVDVHARSTTIRARRTFAAYRASTALRLQRAIEECRQKVTDSLLRADANIQDNDRLGTTLAKTYTLGIDATYRNGATLYSDIVPFAALIGLPNRSHLSLSFAQKSTLFAVAHFNVNKRRPIAPGDPLDDENSENECGTSRLAETGSEDDLMHVQGSQLAAPNMYLDDVEIEDPDL